MAESTTVNQPVSPVADMVNLTCGGSGGYQEIFAAPGVARPHWQSLVEGLSALSPGSYRQLHSRAGRMRHEDGATYNPFDDPEQKSPNWPLDIVPYVLSEQEWAVLEAGIAQRASLLNRVVVDLYGEQRLLHDRVLPPELVLANPHFQRAVHSGFSNTEKPIFLYAVDVFRDVDGTFKVLRDYGSYPVGLGYSLENRIVISRLLSAIYHRIHVHRVAHFFHTIDQAIRQGPGLPDNPAVTILSAGPDEPLYFEEALLSRYLGYPLVEGEDLSVRNGKVYLKKLIGLEQVDIVIRHLQDQLCDPFIWSSQSTRGVAGLLQAQHEGQVRILNSIGSSIADTPALALFMPHISRYLLGEDLLLGQHPGYWCGRPDDLDYVKNNLDNLPPLSSAYSRREATFSAPETNDMLLQSPGAFMSWAPLNPSCIPVWRGADFGAEHTMLRLFACATAEGYSVMRGGLALTAENTSSLLSANPRLQKSKDVWVISDNPVKPFSLMSGLHSITSFSRSSDLPSRVADNLLWLGRYLERTENQTRLLRAAFRRVSGESRPQEITELPFLLDLLRAVQLFAEKQANQHAELSYRELMTGLMDSIYSQQQGTSILNTLSLILRTARNVRDRLSLDCWRVLSHLEELVETPASDPLDLLEKILFNLSGFSGLAMESMTRGLGWRFMDLGRRLERATHQLAIIGAGLQQACRADARNALMVLLEAGDCQMTYRARYRTTIQLGPVLDLLLADESNPKSIAFQFSQLAAHVEELPRNTDRRYASPEERLVLEMLTKVRLLELSGISCGRNPGQFKELEKLLKDLQELLSGFAREITAHYLSRVPTTPHFTLARKGLAP